jgi:hypothetical protein
MASPRTAASALLASPQQQQQHPQQQQSMTLEQMAAMQAAQNLGFHYSGVCVWPLCVCGLAAIRTHQPAACLPDLLIQSPA